MHTQPQITTIIPTYRRPRLLKRAIRSVLNQTYPNFQVCIYDNNSQDETSKVVAEMAGQDSRVKYHRHTENIGAIANCNYGMSKVETPFFSLLCDDDILLPNFYETALEGFERYPKAAFSAGEVLEMTEDGEFLESKLSRWTREGYYHPPESLLEMLGKPPGWTGILFREEVFQRVGYLDPEMGLPADLDFEIRIASEFPIVISRVPCAILVNQSLSLTSNTDLNAYCMSWFRMIKKLSANENIPQDVRVQSGRKVEKQMIRNLFMIRAVARKDYESAYKAVEILRNVFNQRSKANILYLVAFLCEKIPPFYYLLLFMRTLYRRTVTRLRSKYTQKEHAMYTKYLKL